MPGVATSIHIAISRGPDNPRRVQHILQRDPGVLNAIDPTDDDRLTPVRTAAKFGKLNILLHLLEQGAPINDLNDVGWAALHYACYNGHLHVTKALLARGADPTISEGGTPLMWACENGHHEVAAYLINHGGSSVEATDSNGDRALHFIFHRIKDEAAAKVLKVLIEVRGGGVNLPLTLTPPPSPRHIKSGTV